MLARIFTVNGGSECHVLDTKVIPVLGKCVKVGDTWHMVKCFRKLQVTDPDGYYSHAKQPLIAMLAWLKTIGFTKYLIVKPDGKPARGSIITNL